MATQAQIAAVQQLYIGYLGRAADKAGLDFWTNAVSTGVSTLASVATGFTLSTEYKAAFGGLTNDALVEKVYTSVLGRASDTAGKAFWVDALAKGTVTSDKLVATFIGALSAPDQTIINNKTFVAQTYTDTAATANFNKVSAAAAIANVDGTAASVATATAAISNGTLPGLVPGIALVNALSTAATAIDTFAKATAVAHPTFDTGTKDGSVTSVEATAALGTATSARLAAVKAADTSIGAGVTAISTARLSADKSDAVTAAASAKATALKVAVAGSAEASANAKAIADFDAAVVAKAALVLTPEQAQANAVAQAGAAAGVASALTAASPATTYTALAAKAGVTITNIGELYNALKADVDTVSAVEHAALVAEVVKIPGYGSALVASAEKELAVTKAAQAVIDTKALVDAIDSDGPTVSPGAPAPDTGTKQEGKDYTAAATTLADKTAALAAAEKGDIAVATAKAVVDQYATLNKASDDATAAIVKFNLDNSTKFNIAAVATVDATAKQDVFYFPTKIAAADDFAIGGGSIAFGAGDSIVLGSGYTFNAGALTTGNATALEVFFVKGATGTQVVIETNAVGSATTVTDTAGTVTVSNDTAVINLVGVTADHLSFANGVVSYV